MKNLFKIATVVSVGVLLVTGAFAQGKKPMMKAAKCPACKMELSSKMSKATPLAVRVKGKTMYCCAACKSQMPKAMLAKPKPMAKKK